jgi:hypothetical protein
MVFGWLRGNKKSEKKKELDSEHPFDKAAREVNDALARLKMTTDEIEESEAKRETMELLKRMNQ